MPALAELVAPPACGRVFASSVRAGLADAGPSGRVHLDAIARWLQDVAYLDVRDAGLAGAGVWVVRRTRLRVERFPRFDEVVTLRTFCSALGRVWAERGTELRGSDGARADASALWVFVDPLSGRPARLDGLMGEPYAEAAGGRRVSSRRRHPPPPRCPSVTLPWGFRATDLDLAGHVNNAAYWAPVEEVLAASSGAGGAEPDALDVEIEYRTPAGVGDAVVLREDPLLWIAAPDGELHASAVVLPGGAGDGPAG